MAAIMEIVCLEDVRPFDYRFWNDACTECFIRIRMGEQAVLLNHETCDLLFQAASLMLPPPSSIPSSPENNSTNSTNKNKTEQSSSSQQQQPQPQQPQAKGRPAPPRCLFMCERLVCREHASGQKKGPAPECEFVHAKRDPFQERSAAQKAVCVFHVNQPEGCTRGIKCNFVHVDPQGLSSEQRQACNRHQQIIQTYWRGAFYQNHKRGGR